MKQLVFIPPSGNQLEPFTTSDIVADCAEVKHRAVRQLIQRYENDLESLGLVAFEMRAVKKERGIKHEKIYHLNEPQASLLITYLKNTAPVRDFKKELVRQFYEMRSFIRELQSPIWRDTRSLGKEIRKRETDSIKALVDYAKGQGSQHAERYYKNLSNLADSVAGISDRDRATVVQLNTLLLLEGMIEEEIQKGISAGQPYKTVYQACKDRLNGFSALISPARLA